MDSGSYAALCARLGVQLPNALQDALGRLEEQRKKTPDCEAYIQWLEGHLEAIELHLHATRADLARLREASRAPRGRGACFPGRGR